MNVTVFNPAQLQVLEMMSFVDSPEALAELKKGMKKKLITSTNCTNVLHINEYEKLLQ